MNSIGIRMKANYEDRSRAKLVRRMPVILRLDGKAFHTLTRDCDRPFDSFLNIALVEAALELMREVQGAKLAYVQSDEISLLLTDYGRLSTEAWFDYNVQKMCSVAASMASVRFWSYYRKPGLFDCRAFNIPKEEVANYFLWRWLDWERNSVQMAAQAIYSHKELHQKKIPDLHEMLHLKGINWNDYDPRWKNGTFAKKDEEGFLHITHDNLREGRGFIDTLVNPPEDILM